MCRILLTSIMIAWLTSSQRLEASIVYEFVQSATGTVLAEMDASSIADPTSSFSLVGLDYFFTAAGESFFGTNPVIGTWEITAPHFVFEEASGRLVAPTGHSESSDLTSSSFLNGAFPVIVVTDVSSVDQSMNASLEARVTGAPSGRTAIGEWRRAAQPPTQGVVPEPASITAWAFLLLLASGLGVGRYRLRELT